MCSTLQEHFAARRAKMEEDPTKVPEIPGDHHAEFREQFCRSTSGCASSSPPRASQEASGADPARLHGTWCHPVLPGGGDADPE